MAIDFYISELPVFTRLNKKCQDGSVNYHKVEPKIYLHGIGCKDWGDCFTCPKKDCTWQPCQKPRNRAKSK